MPRYTHIALRRQHNLAPFKLGKKQQATYAKNTRYFSINATSVDARV